MKKVYCPYCKKEEEYKIENRNIESFKGIKIYTFENVAICKKCNNSLYIDAIEIENNKRIYEEYRNKLDIIKPDEITNFREKYDLSQRELTSILGFGKMTINRYEHGEVPSKSQSDYLKVIINNNQEFILKVKESFDNKNITEKTFNKIMNVNQNSSVISDEIDDNEILKRNIENSLKLAPNIYNGYNTLDIEKLENIISYIASKVDNLTITSLNKYLWFIDCLYFKRNCISITGLTYEHEQFGPTIINKKYKTLSLLDDKFISVNYEEDNFTKTLIESNNYDISNINEDEKETIDEIIKVLKNKKVSEISNLSHEEDGWKKTRNFEKISFKYAINLKLK